MSRVSESKFTAETLIDEIDRLGQSKNRLEEEVAGYERELQAKQQELLMSESRDTLRQAKAAKELDDTANQLSELERRISTAQETLRSQEENVSEAFDVSQQWDAYIQSLRAKCDEMQVTSSNINQQVQTLSAEKQRAETELALTIRKLSETQEQSVDAEKQLMFLRDGINAAITQNGEIELVMADFRRRLETSEKQLSDQQRRLDSQAEAIRVTSQEIAEKAERLSELVVAEGRLVDRCAAMEETLRRAEANNSKSKALSARIEKPTRDLNITSEITVPQEALLEEIESLVNDLEQSSDDVPEPRFSEGVKPVGGSGNASRINPSKNDSADPWANVFQ